MLPRTTLGALTLIHFPGNFQIHLPFSLLFANKDSHTHKTKILPLNFHPRNRLHLESLPFTTTFKYQMVIAAQATAEFPVLLSSWWKLRVTNDSSWEFYECSRTSATPLNKQPYHWQIFNETDYFPVFFTYLWPPLQKCFHCRLIKSFFIFYCCVNAKT